MFTFGGLQYNIVILLCIMYICGGGDGIIHCVRGQDCIIEGILLHEFGRDKRVVKPFAGCFVIRPLLFDLQKYYAPCMEI